MPVSRGEAWLVIETDASESSGLGASISLILGEGKTTGKNARRNPPTSFGFMGKYECQTDFREVAQP